MLSTATLFITAALAGVGVRADVSDSTTSNPSVLVYTRTVGFRHDSIPTAIEVLRAEGPYHGLNFSFTEDPGWFNDGTLAQFDGVMFVHTSEEVLDYDGQAALQRFFQHGGVFTGVHVASGCLYHDKTYEQVIGAFFDFHPERQNATFVREVKDHPATIGIPDRWRFEEEVYFFGSDPRSKGATVVVSVDDSSYGFDSGWEDNLKAMGHPHPIAWYNDKPESAQPLLDGATKPGRSFYTALGHLNETWLDPTFQSHLFGGLSWALDGASTKAYGGQGVVGNTAAKPPKPTHTTIRPAPSETATSSEPLLTPSVGAGSGNSFEGKQAKNAASRALVSSAAVVVAVVAAVVSMV